jgi:hypothetical protein
VVFQFTVSVALIIGTAITFHQINVNLVQAAGDGPGYSDVQQIEAAPPLGEPKPQH